MTTVQLTVVGDGLFFVFIFLSGLWLSRQERPFNSVVLTIHKLISLAAGILLVVTVYQTNQVATLGATELVAGVVTGLLFLGTGISGGLVSTDHSQPPAVLYIHRITPFLTALSTAVTLYVLLRPM
jgi:hypothetical protein